MVSWRGFCLAFLTLLALERLGELILARRNARRAFAQGAIEIGQREYRVMALFHSLFLAVCFAVALLGSAQRTFVGECALVGALLAQALRYWAIRTLGERWNVRVIVLPTAPAVVAGPYRFIRHPNYVAVCAEMLCIPLVCAGASGAGLLVALVFTIGNALILRRRIRTEEQALGPAYARAFAATPRFIPGGIS